VTGGHVDGPTITAASVGPGHDGRAEVVIELLYPNGARSTMSVPEEAAGRALDQAGLTEMSQLVGRSWMLLVERPT
jgi:hypothetical protein